MFLLPFQRQPSWAEDKGTGIVDRKNFKFALACGDHFVRIVEVPKLALVLLSPRVDFGVFGVPWWLCHGCWEAFYIFAYCGFVVDIQPVHC